MRLGSNKKLTRPRRSSHSVCIPMKSYPIFMQGENTFCFCLLLRRREAKLVQGKRKVSIAGYFWIRGGELGSHDDDGR